MMRIIRTILIILGMITAYALKRSDSVVDRDHADNDQNNSGRPPPERVAPVGAENSSLSEKSGNKQQSGAETSLGPAENAIVQYTKELAAWTRRLAILTGLLVVVTGILGAIALRTDNTLKETMIHSQRAWVGPYDASIEPISLQKTTSATVSIHNTGKEPALNVHFDGGASVFGRETSAEADANT